MAKTTLDNSYFSGPLTVAQISEPSVTRNLLHFILTYEEQYLKLLLGQALYDEYVLGMDEGAPEQKWLNLDAQLYITITQGVNNIKLSPAANYVYWFYVRNATTNTTGSGEVVFQSEGAIPAGSAVKAKLAWNAMVKMGKDIKGWLMARPDVYPSYVEPVPSCTSDEEAIRLYNERINILKTIIPFF